MTTETPSLRVLINALEDIKAKDLRILNVQRKTPLYDTLIIASAESSRQVKALAHNAKAKWKEAGGIVLGMEGEENGEWIVLDCESVIVHIMQTAMRQYYYLEELWLTPTNQIDPQTLSLFSSESSAA